MKNHLQRVVEFDAEYARRHPETPPDIVRDVLSMRRRDARNGAAFAPFAPPQAQVIQMTGRPL